MIADEWPLDPMPEAAGGQMWVGQQVERTSRDTSGDTGGLQRQHRVVAVPTAGPRVDDRFKLILARTAFHGGQRGEIVPAKHTGQRPPRGVTGDRDGEPDIVALATKAAMRDVRWMAIAAARRGAASRGLLNQGGRD